MRAALLHERQCMCVAVEAPTLTPCGVRGPTAAEETVKSESVFGPDDEYEDSSQSGKEEKTRNQDDAWLRKSSFLRDWNMLV
jgi:hypothetical protein